jgi:hypothetical protein
VNGDDIAHVLEDMDYGCEQEEVEQHEQEEKEDCVSSHILIKVKFVYKFDLQNLEGQPALPAPVSECHNSPSLKGVPSSSKANLHPYREKE